MSEEELRRLLQEAVADKERRSSDRKMEIQFMAIASYTALAAFIGGCVLWVSDARTGQAIQPLANKQLVMEGEIKNQDKMILKMDEKLDKIVEKLSK